jgi:hypothetical protein
VSAHRRLGVAATLVGLGLAAASRVLVPSAPPLYDGVVVNEPYRWLQPPPGELGGAQGFSSTDALEAGKSPLIAAQTPEQPPQASVFAPPEALELPAGTTTLQTSITPIPAPAAPASGRIAGNVYRIAITNQQGLAVAASPDTFVSVVLRGPEGTTDATIERFENGAWLPLETDHAGYTSGFLSIVTEFGDFTLVAPDSGATASASTTVVTTTTSASPPGSGIPTVVLLVGGAGLLVLAATGLYAMRSRPAQPPPKRGRDRRRRR